MERNFKSIFLLVILTPLFVLSQVGKEKEKKKPTGTSNTVKPQRLVTKVSAMYCVTDSAILIRWAPSNVEGWRAGNLFGYVVERFTIMRNNEMLEKPEYFRLFGIIPDSLLYWQGLIETNDYAAVMAQALYGEHFSVDIGNAAKVASGANSILGKAEEQKQRFLFAMYAADLDFHVAEKAALGFIDKKIKGNERYFYRIYPAAPSVYLKSDTALLYVSSDEKKILPETAEPIVEQSNKAVVLSWDAERTKKYYNAFFIERKSASDSIFTPVNTIPFTNMSANVQERYGNAIVYTDTGLINNLTYYYRIQGKTIFGVKGPWSDTVAITCLPLLEGVPGIEGIRLDKNGQTWLKWFFEDSLRPKINSFEIHYSASGKGAFKQIIRDVKPSAFETALPDSLSAGYLMVKAIPISGLPRTSFPYLYQPEDSIAPASPKGVTGIIDSSGVVVLKWLPNKEKDLLGYKVFRSFLPQEEKAVLVDTVWFGNEFRDTLSLKLKNPKAYYTVCALDTRHNQSVQSAEVIIVKPDRIAPTSPVFKDYVLGEGWIEIKWINSSDEDVKQVILQRKLHHESVWSTVFASYQEDSVYRDKNVLPLQQYDYRLYAIDSSGLQSRDAQIMLVTAAKVVNREGITKVDALVDREKKLLYINWDFRKGEQIKNVEIFKGDELAPISLYKVLPSTSKDLIESELIINTKYTYGIRVQFSSGEYSDMVIKNIIY